VEDQVKLRNFTSSDLSRVLKIERTCFGKEAFTSVYFKYLHQYYGNTFIVAEHNSKIVGYVIGREEITDDDLLLPSDSSIILNHIRAEKTGDIISLAVIPNYRRRGIAHLMIDYILERLEKSDVKQVVLMVKVNNDPAINLYKKAGFQIKQLIENYYTSNGDGYLMYLRF
jgi:ribosomal-protein-alanine N-acetyltransferase